jgi:CTP synthase (UTP-ammonia lyase)
MAQQVQITPGTLVHQAYQRDIVIEEFRCNYGLNPRYRDRIGDGGFGIAGVDSKGEVRIVELSDHRFFVATLFLPQLSSSAETPHPLVIAYLKAALAFGSLRQE